MAKGVETQMENAMDHRWMKLFIYALIAAVFGMVIYLVVKAEQDPERYMVTIAIPLEGATPEPKFDTEDDPTGSNGTLEKGIETVRTSLKLHLADSTLTENQLSVPDASEWRVGIRTDSALSSTAVYSFPSSSTLTDTKSWVTSLIGTPGAFSVTELFKESTTGVQTWSNEVFKSSSSVAVGITYGNHGSAQSNA